MFDAQMIRESEGAPQDGGQVATAWLSQIDSAAEVAAAEAAAEAGAAEAAEQSAEVH